MNHADHVALLRGGITSPGGVWADLGAGGGAFTLALADLLGPDGVIHAVDKDAWAVRDLERTAQARFPSVAVHGRQADFTKPLALPPLDGIVMANSLHFIPEAQRMGVVRLVKSYLRPGGRLIIVEYAADRGNIWVPHPFSYATWEALARSVGFAHTEKLHSVPSSFMGAIYSAVSW